LVEVRAWDGRVVLVDSPDRAMVGPSEVTELADAGLGLPAELVTAFGEWARVAEAVLAGGDGRPGAAARSLVTRRGRQLVRQLAESVDSPVRFVDPITGDSELVRPFRPAPRPVPIVEPTPWATGLTVSVILGLVVTLIIVQLSMGLAGAGVWLAVIANLLIGGGLTPSLWLARGVPTWRWVSLGTVSGMLLGWCALLFLALTSR
jgi:hypothetical protein